MAINQKNVAKQILDAVGGAENINAVENCVTRLRFNLKDTSKSSKKTLEKIEGVKGVVVLNGQPQVVMGELASDIFKIYQKDGTISETLDSESPRAVKMSVFDRVMDTVAGSLSLIIPIVLTSGLFQVLAYLLLTLQVIEAGSDIYNFFIFIGSAGFYFLPVFVGYSAAKKMKTNPAIGMLLGAVLVFPDLANALASEEGFHILGLAVPAVTYSSTVIPILLSVWVMSYVDRIIKRFMPKTLSTLFTPVLLTLIMVPIALLIVGPIGIYFGSFIATILTGLFDANMGWLAVVILAVLFPLLVMAGAHWAVLPISLEFFGTMGYDPLMSPAGLAYNFSLLGVALAVALKTKNANMKTTAFSSVASGLMGISEPALFAVALRLKQTMVGLFAGAAVGGLIGGLLQLKGFAFVLAGVIAIPAYNDGGNGILYSVLVIVASTAVSFLITYFRGFKDIDKFVEE